MSAADRAVALSQANERLQLVFWLCIGLIVAIVCARYALRWLAARQEHKRRQALRAEAVRYARVAQTELCRQRIEFLRGRSIHLPRETAPSGRTVTSIRREKAAMN